MNTQIERDFRIIKERVQELLGQRGNSPAVRAKAITQQSKPITDAPTADDYNRLVADISAIIKAIGAG